MRSSRLGAGCNVPSKRTSGTGCAAPSESDAVVSVCDAARAATTRLADSLDDFEEDEREREGMSGSSLSTERALQGSIHRQSSSRPLRFIETGPMGNYWKNHAPIGPARSLRAHPDNKYNAQPLCGHLHRTAPPSGMRTRRYSSRMKIVAGCSNDSLSAWIIEAASCPSTKR